MSPPEAAVEDDEDVVLRDRLGTSELCRTPDAGLAFFSLAARMSRWSWDTHSDCSSVDRAWNKCRVWTVVAALPVLKSILGPPPMDMVDTT